MNKTVEALKKAQMLSYDKLISAEISQLGGFTIGKMSLPTSLSTLEQKLLRALDQLAVIKATKEEHWSLEEAEVYESAISGLPHTPLERCFCCAYCGTTKTSNTNTGSDISCCGEVGHVEIYYKLLETPNGPA